MKTDKGIEKLIRESLGMEAAPDGFTDRIMDKIIKEEMVKDEALRSVFGKYVLESPSPEFAEATIAKVESLQSKLGYSSVIGKKAWIFIFVFVSSIFLFALLQQDSSMSSTGVVGGMIDQAWNKLSSQNFSLNWQLPAFLTNPLVGFSLLAISSLLLIDKMLHERRISVSV